MSKNNKSERTQNSNLKEDLNSSRLVNVKKIKPIKHITPKDKISENNSRNKLFLQQQKNYLKNRKIPLISNWLSRRAEIKKALKKIKTYEKAPFTFVFGLTLMSMVLSAYSILTSMLIESVEFMANLVKTLTWIGWIVGEVVDLSFQAIGFGITVFITMIQLAITAYIAYFRWKYSSFLRRKLLKRYLWIFVPFLSIVPIANLIPWPLLSIYLLHKHLKKRAKDGQKVLKKYNIRY